MIYEQFLKLLEDESIKVVSFDLFDTLVYRTLFEPHDIFSHLGNARIAKQRALFEEKVRRESPKEDILLEDIYGALCSADETALHVQTELDAEAKHIYANQTLDEWIKLAHEAGKRVIVISDFYMRAKELDEIALSKLQNRSLVQKVYASGEEGVLKYTGNLFKKVLQSEGIKPEELLHVGDKQKQDYLVPKSLGIKTCFVGMSKNVQKAYDIEKIFLTQRPHLLQAFRQHTCIHAPYKQDTYYEIGAYVFAPALYAFARFVLKNCVKDSLGQVNILMREGRIFKKVFEQVKKSDERFEAIEVNLIYASRASLFFPFLDGEAVDDSHLIYGEMDVEEYFELYRTEAPNEHKNTKLLDAKKSYVQEGVTLYDALKGQLVGQKESIAQKSREQAELFGEYLEQSGYKKESVLLDFGGSGSMFKVIEGLLKERTPSKYMLFFEQQKALLNPLKLESFFPYEGEFIKSCDAMLEYAPLIEVLFNAETGTTTGYKKENGVVMPECAAGFEAEGFKAFDKGVEDFIALQKNGLYDIMGERLAYAQIIERLLVAPTGKEAEALGSLPFEMDAKGTRQVSFLNEKSLQVMQSKGLQNYLYEFMRYGDRRKLFCFWPYGEIAKADENILPKLYNKNFYTTPNETDVQSLVKNLRKKELKGCCVFGAGAFLEELLPELEALGITINTIADSNPKAATLYGYELLYPHQAIQKGEKVFVIASGSFYKQMKEQLLALDADLTIITVQEDE